MATTRSKTSKAKKTPQVTLPEVDELTGMRVDTQSFVVATEMMAGGATKQEVLDRLKELLPAESINGNPNRIDQKVHTILKRLQEQGFTIESSWVLVPPANGKRKAPAKKAPAKKATATKRTAKKAPARKAPAKRTTARKVVKKKVTPTGRRKASS